MNSIGVRRFIARCFSGSVAGLIVSSLFVSGILFAQCTPQKLSPQEKASTLEKLLKTAESAMEQSKFAEAARGYGEALCLAPDNAQAHYGLGVAKAGSGDFVSARNSLETADRLDPSNPLPLSMQVRVNFELHDIAAMKSVLLQASRRFPSDTELHSALAYFLTGRKLFDLALAELLRVRHAGSEDADASVGLAVLENAAGAYDDAIRNANAIEQNTRFKSLVRASAAGVVGLSYENIGRRDDAIRHLQNAIQLDPSRENSYLALAFLFEESQKYAQAVQVLESGRRNLPASTSLLLPLGANLIRAEQYDAGLSVLRDLIGRTPDEPDAYVSMADAYRKTGNPQSEVRALEKLAALHPDYPAIHVLIARALLSTDPPENAKALDELALAGKRDPSDAEVYTLRGKIDLSLGRDQEAVKALQRAIELRPMDPSAYYLLGRLYQKLGQTDLAARQFERIRLLEQNERK